MAVFWKAIIGIPQGPVAEQWARVRTLRSMGTDGKMPLRCSHETGGSYSYSTPAIPKGAAENSTISCCQQK